MHNGVAPSYSLSPMDTQLSFLRSPTQTRCISSATGPQIVDLTDANERPDTYRE